MLREKVFLVPWAPMYLFVGGLEREVDSRTPGEFWCSDIPAEASLAKASSSLSLFGKWCSFLHVLLFLIKERAFSFLPLLWYSCCPLWNLFPLWMIHADLFSSLILTINTSTMLMDLEGIKLSEILHWNINLKYFFGSWEVAWERGDPGR